MNKKHDYPNISAVVFCFNDEQFNSEYLETITFASDIIVFNYSKNNKKIGLIKNSKIDYLENEFNDFSALFKKAVAIAKNDWIFLFEINELLTSELKAELIRTPAINKYKAYFINHNFIFFDKEIKYGGLKNRKTIRFFNKNYCQVNTDNFDSAIQTKEKVGVLENRLNDCSYSSFDLYNEKLNIFSRIKADNLFNNNNSKPYYYQFLFKPFQKFVTQYFFKLGFLDGKEGYILAYINSFAVLKCYLSLWLKYKKME
ncbi:glycosyltransferase family protein [Flavobacterium cellulosilyticum]|uniref:Glycosyltransferase family 2 protein n=1 Tax=Flavobacterium cellulosilyticum TaxID=2541731 RepID=A0A4V2YZV6_9FLAO|nr:hypothetical protein [Flavobacterium cellulosilyticum]TDD98637.1 hypothetical protein E0F76_05795 [Flavobacterium cellulosilyticum]